MPERPWYLRPFWRRFMRAAVSHLVAFAYLFGMFGMGIYVGTALARDQAVAAWLVSLAAFAHGALYARWQRLMFRDAVIEVMRYTREEARNV